MSRANLKKQLHNLTAPQLAELLLELYDIRKEAREYLEFWANPEPKKWTEKYEKDVRRVFYSSLTMPRRKPSLTELNNIVKHYMTLGLDPEFTAEFLLYVAETECEWLEQRWRRLSYRTSMLKNFENARLYTENAYPNENPFAIRLEKLHDRVSALFYWIK